MGNTIFMVLCFLDLHVKPNKHYLNNEGNIQILICLSVLTHAAPSYAFAHGKDIYLDKDPHLLVIMEQQWKMSFG